MVVSQSIMSGRGVLRVIARTICQGQGEVTSSSMVYDVEIDGQEVLHTFISLDEAIQFLDMVAPSNGQPGFASDT